MREDLPLAVRLGKRAVCFSGGKDSTAMLLMMIERGMHISKIVYVDSGKEFPAMYKHITAVEKAIAPLKITRVGFDFDYWFQRHIYSAGPNKGKVGYGWPNYFERWCTTMKIHALTKAFRPLGKHVIRHVGITVDEKGRCKSSSNHLLRYPLVEWGVSGRDTFRYCYKRGFTWDGLYEKFGRVSCFCCPLARVGSFRTLYEDFPDLWSKIKEMDRHSRHPFTKTATLAELEARFEKEKE